MTASPLTALAGKPLRRDAAQNRQRLLLAAGQVFAEHGLEAGVEEVARAAGVGMGTLYRRFPTKQALIDELIGALRLSLLELARTASTRTDGTGLEELMFAAGQLQADEPGCLSRLWEHSDAELASLREFRLLLATLLDQAQRLGRIRTDVVVTDISISLWALRGVIETTRAVAPSAWRRHLELTLAGLRPVAEASLASTLKAKPLTDAQARRIARTDPAEPAG